MARFVPIDFDELDRLIPLEKPWREVIQERGVDVETVRSIEINSSPDSVVPSVIVDSRLVFSLPPRRVGT